VDTSRPSARHLGPPKTARPPARLLRFPQYLSSRLYSGKSRICGASWPRAFGQRHPRHFVCFLPSQSSRISCGSSRLLWARETSSGLPRRPPLRSRHINRSLRSRLPPRLHLKTSWPAGGPSLPYLPPSALRSLTFPCSGHFSAIRSSSLSTS
jgi:hypothetical protein